MPIKFTELPAVSTLVDADILAVVDISAGASGSSKITVADFRTVLFNTAAPTFTEITLSDTTPRVKWIETDVALDQKRWDARANASIFELRTLFDSDAAGEVILSVTRSSEAVGIVSIDNGTFNIQESMTVNSVAFLDVSRNITAARVIAISSSQHEFEIQDAGTSNVLIPLAVTHQTSGDMVDGFGSGIDFIIQDGGSNASIGQIFATRNGADNSGEIVINPLNAGAGTNVVTIAPAGVTILATGTVLNIDRGTVAGAFTWQTLSASAATRWTQRSNTANFDMVFDNNAAATVLTIFQAGSIDIGTGDLQVAGTVRINSTGGGIFTTITASSTVTISGNVLIDTGVSSDALRIRGTAPTFQLFEDDGSADENYQIAVLDGFLTFQTNNDTFSAATSQLTITQAGTLNFINGDLQLATVTRITNAGAATFASLIVDTTTLVVDAPNNRVGIGIAAPLVDLHLTTNSSIRMESSASGVTALTNGMSGLELIAQSMDVTNKYTRAIKFMSTDTQFTTENPKFLAAIVGRSTEAYAADADGGMAIDFFTTPDSPGATNVPVLAMSINQAGNVGIGIEVAIEPLHVKIADDGLAVTDVLDDGIILEGSSSIFFKFRKANSVFGGLLFNDGIDGDAASIRHLFDGANSRYEFRLNNAEIFRMSSDAGVVVNEGSLAAVNFRVESDAETHMLFVDAGLNRIGIGDSTPSQTLDITGNVGISGTEVIDVSRNLVNIVNATLTGNITAVVDITMSGDLTIADEFATQETTPTTITSNQDDFATADMSYMRLNADAGRNISGGVNGRRLVIVNISAFTITFTHQDVASTAANRIITIDGGTISMLTGRSVELIYDSVVSRWHMINLA